MRMLTRTLFIVGLLAALVLSAGCGKKAPNVERPTGKLAVATFTNPVYTWELLAGYIPVEEGKRVSKEVLTKLDATLASALAEHGVIDYTPASVTRQCQEIVVMEQNNIPRMSAWKYWKGVGECMEADYLLVPQLLHWEERVGSSGGVVKPASVVLDLFLISIKDGSLIRAHFDETQVALSDNLLTIDKFVDRGGKWVTAERLAADGIKEKLLELGL